MSEENQYINLIRYILENGTREVSRNGTVISTFGQSMRFSLRDGTLPLLTTKRVAWKTCFEELRWFLRGSTNNQELRDCGVHIWDGNSTREFLDSRGLEDRIEGDLGPIYGHQWRHFDASYIDCFTDYHGKGVDQLQNIIDDLKNPTARSSRRLVMTAWNPNQLDQMALPPCHVLTQFHVKEGRYLSCSLYQRSCDLGLGVPFNIASYAFLTHLLAKHCDLEAEEFVYFMGDCHIYEGHTEALKEQIERESMPFPQICISSVHDKIEDYVIGDIEWTKPYVSHSSVKMNMVA